MNNYPLLKKQYPQIDFGALTPNDIIYFCRDVLSSHRTNQPLRSGYEKEILNLIKEFKNLDFNWFSKDNDRNIILTYPVYNNAYSIVDYLLTHHYKLDTYNKDISSAICSGVLLNGSMLNHLLNTYSFNESYKNDMLMKSYNLARCVSDENSVHYFSHSVTIMNKNLSFEKSLLSLISHPEDSIFDQSLPVYLDHIYHFLNHHPLPIEEKIIFLDKLAYLENYFSSKEIKTYELKKKMEAIEKWKLHFKLLKNLPSATFNLNKKVKI